MSMHPGAGRSTTIFRRSCWLCGGDSPISGERAKLPRGYTASRCIPAFRLSAAGCGVRKACAFRSTWRATRYAGPRAARRAVCGDLTLGPARPGADPAVARRTSRRGDRRHHGPVSRQCGRETDPYPLQTA